MTAFKIAGGVLSLSVLSFGLLPGAYAVPTLTHAKQATITRAANSMSGTALGGSYTYSGAGLTQIQLPTISAAGLVGIPDDGGGNPVRTTTAADTTFSMSVSIGQADIANTATTQVAGLGAGSFGDMTTKASDTVGGVAVGTITISAAGAITAAAGAGTGSSVTGIMSTNATGRNGSIENRRVATSGNTQLVVDSDRQETSATASGSNLNAMTNFGFGTNTNGTLGTALAADVMAGATAASATGLANGFTASANITDGQNTAAMGLTSVNVTRPAYGIVTEQAGGTTAGALTFTNLNAITAVGGGAGTTSSLSFIQEMTAF